MSNNSKKELLEWLALKPRTQGWGAVVVYDRNKCNNLLLQDYINKFSSDSYLPPINKPVPTGSANWEHLHDWITDVPRLSFEDSSKTAGGEAHMKMAVIGGTQVAIDNATGVKRAIAIHSIDALDHPELIAENVLLSKTSGTVGKDTGEVVLDLGDEQTAKGIWELTFANTQHERRLGGKFFKDYYKAADKEKRLYHLGKVAYTEQQFLKPASFIVRTLTAKAAQSETADNVGDGLVELFVRMEGEPEGGTPPTDDWRSLIVGGNDCSVLIANKLVMKKSVLPGAEMTPTYGKLSLIEMMQNGFLRGYVASDEDNAVLKFLLQEFQVGAYTLNPYIEISTLLTVKGHPFTVATVIEGVDAGKINVTWDNSDDQNGIPLAVRRAGSSTVIGYGTLLYNRSISALYRYQVNAATGVATFVLDRSTVTAEFKEHPRSNNLKQWFSAGEIAVIMKNLSDQAVVELQKVLRNIEESAVSLDYFVLNSILFNNETHIKTEESSMPGDLIFFGQFNYPFTISPLEYLMGHGTTHKFQVSPEYKGDLQWEVSAVPGSTGAIGSINQEGVYTSPAITDIGGTFTRVRVTAKDKQSQYSSSALVTVVVRDITINPVVQICNASTPSTLETRTLSANTLGEGILEWKVKTGGGTIPLTAGPDRKNIYTAGQQDSSVGTLSVDEIEVRNLATQKTQSSYVVVTHDSSDRLTITIVMEESSFPAGKAKLVVMKRGSELPVDWEVVVGNGEIDDSGMYTGRDGQHRFALIVATDKTDEYRKGWIILPWPLFELPDKPPDDFLE